MKHLAKQKAGKARLKERSMCVPRLRSITLALRPSRLTVSSSPLLSSLPSLAPVLQPLPSRSLLARRHARSGRITIPTEAFHAVLGGQEVKRKGQAADKDKRKKH